jgi:MFS family permease
MSAIVRPSDAVITKQRSTQETRLIMIRIVILAFILFFSSITTAYADAILPDMMVNLKVANSKSESGRPASWLSSAFFFGRFLSASVWGAYIDKHGRKKGLLLVLALLIMCTLLFGLSVNFYYALVIKFITGLSNGLSILGKTLSTEICPDDMKPWSISVTNTIWSLGMTLGPLIGASVYNIVPQFPILISSLNVCIIGTILFFLSMKYFEETLDQTKITSTHAPVILQDNEDNSQDDDELKQADDSANIGVGKSYPESKKVLGSEILAIPNVAKIITIFSANTFYAAVLMSLIPFWIASKYEDGGLDFKYHDISDIFLYLMLPQIILQIFLYPAIQKKRGDFWLLTRGHFAHLPLFFMLPYAHSFGRGALLPQKVWITFWLFTRNLASFMNFAVLQRYGNEVISSQNRGKMNGIQITFSSAFQICGTFLGGWLLTWSETNTLSYPFNYHFVFIIMTLLTLGVIKVVYSLKFSDSQKAKIVGENNVM